MRRSSRSVPARSRSHQWLERHATESDRVHDGLSRSRGAIQGSQSREREPMACVRAFSTAVVIGTSALMGTLLAQAPPAPGTAPKPDTPAVTRHVETARKAAGGEWTQAVDFICVADPNNSANFPWPDDPLIEPTKVFDNA